MNKLRHTGLTLFGIYWNIFTSAAFFVFGVFVLSWTFFRGIEFLDATISLIGVLSFFIGTITFYMNINLLNFKTKDYFLVGVVSLIPSFLIGGLIILIGGKNSIRYYIIQKHKIETSDLEEKLKTLESLLERRVITKEEYDLKRKDIIIKF
jgi:surface polysaccharide O-acyltransferase-like enzyme